MTAQAVEEDGGVNRPIEKLELQPFNLCTVEQFCSCRLPGDQNDLAVWQVLPNADGGLNSGHSQHADITDQHVGLQNFRRFHCRFATVDGGGIESSLVEDEGQSVGRQRFVIDDEHPKSLIYLEHVHLLENPGENQKSHKKTTGWDFAEGDRRIPGPTKSYVYLSDETWIRPPTTAQPLRNKTKDSKSARQTFAAITSSPWRGSW